MTTGDCLFCKIVEKKIPATIEYEDKEMVVIQDINPQAPLHFLIISRRHIARIADLEEADERLVGRMVRMGKKLGDEKGVSESGFRLVFNSGAEAGQSVFHIHLHFLAGRRMKWPPG